MPLQEIHERLAKHCQDIYTTDFLEMHRHIDNQDTGVQCAFIVEGSQLIICFRGSDSLLTDWRMNFHMSQSEYPVGSGCFVHSGFLVQWVSIEKRFRQIMEEMLEDSKDRVNSVVFCGHSAGAQCLIAAYSTRELIQKLGLTSRAVTFGAPRVGNDKFKEEIESSMECERIVLDRDVITRVPIFGYQHIGKPLQIRDEEVLERDTSNLEQIHWMLLGARNADLGIKDHFVWNYYAAIRRHLKESGEEEEKP